MCMNVCIGERITINKRRMMNKEKVEEIVRLAKCVNRTVKLVEMYEENLIAIERDLGKMEISINEAKSTLAVFERELEEAING